MKKYIGITVLGLFMLTGCGAGATETMSCTYDNTTGNLTSRITYNIDYQDDEVKKLRVTYKYHSDDTNTADTNDANNATDNNNGTNTGDNNNKQMDGVGTGTDGTTDDSQIDDDGIVDGIVGSAIDSIINGVTTTILDISGLRDRHATVQSTYGNMTGFSVQNTSDATDNDYTVSYVIDYDSISDDDLNTLNLSRDINTLRSNYTNQGFTCK